MKKTESGFTLLEVVVAFAILSVGLGSFYLLFETGLERTTRFTDKSEALHLIQSHLSASLAMGDFENSRQQEGRFNWQIIYKIPQKKINNRQSWQLYDVEATIHWQGRKGEESLSLVTKRIAPVNGAR